MQNLITHFYDLESIQDRNSRASVDVECPGFEMTPDEVIADFKLAVDRGSAQRFGAIYSQVIEMFVADAERFGEEQVDFFEALFGCLIPKASRSSLVDFRTRLMDLPRVPKKVIGLLSRHPDILVSGPVIESSICLLDEDLLEIAKMHTRPHLLALAAHPHLSEEITEILLERGDLDITRRVIANKDALISERGFARAISAAARHTSLKAEILQRQDLPEELRPWLRDEVAS
jgi:uncharacterized protein (DUF2336 family)